MPAVKNWKSAAFRHGHSGFEELSRADDAQRPLQDCMATVVDAVMRFDGLVYREKLTAHRSHAQQNPGDNSRTHRPGWAGPLLKQVSRALHPWLQFLYDGQRPGDGIFFRLSRKRFQNQSHRRCRVAVTVSQRHRDRHGAVLPPEVNASIGDDIGGFLGGQSPDFIGLEAGKNDRR